MKPFNDGASVLIQGKIKDPVISITVEIGIYTLNIQLQRVTAPSQRSARF